MVLMGFSVGSNDKESPTNAGDTGWILGPGRPPGGGNGNPLQYSCPGNLMDRGAWWVGQVGTVPGVTENRTGLSLSNNSKAVLTRPVDSSWPSSMRWGGGGEGRGAGVDNRGGRRGLPRPAHCFSSTAFSLHCDNSVPTSVFPSVSGKPLYLSKGSEHILLVAAGSTRLK